jgi:hypothetical protein
MPRDCSHDFDFLFGAWRVRNRRLVEFQDRHIFNRFIWTMHGPDSCRWEPAYSVDGGRSWETNWTMEFTRLE